MKLINRGDNNLSHSFFKEGKFEIITLKVNEALEVPEHIAKIWIDYPSVERYVDKEDIEIEKEKAVKEALKKVATKKTATKKTYRKKKESKK